LAFQIAVDGVRAAAHKHRFLGVTKVGSYCLIASLSLAATIEPYLAASSVLALSAKTFDQNRRNGPV